MARGEPQLWSAILGLPFIVSGLWLYLGQSEYPPTAGLPFILFGVFIVAIGAYIGRVAPEEPTLQEEEQMITTRHPTQRVAMVKVGTGLPLLIVTVYLLYFTTVPYVYPTVTLAVGLFQFSTGLYTYWTNLLTKYYVTSDRIIKEYRFLSLRKEELPLHKVRGVQERKSVIETLVGLGNVRVASGGGRSLEIIMRNMNESDKFAREVRVAMSEK